MKTSPCLHCVRVENPAECENKNCNVWRRWFIGRWEEMRGCARRARNNGPAEPAGVPLGGRHYAAPHETLRYLETDPCESCPCPADLCAVPCRTRLAWESAREEVFG